MSTPLHDAVKSQDYGTAARLLAAGEDYRAANGSGLSALSPQFATLAGLHRIRQEYQRLSQATSVTDDVDSRAAGWAQQLMRDGFVRIPAFADAEALAKIQADFSSTVARLDRGRFWRYRFQHYDQREYWRRPHRAYTSNDPVGESPAILELCRHPALLQTADAYLRKPAHLRRVVGMRYLPAAALDTQQFAWHHDMEDRQFKVMALLTDIGPQDQYMAYVRGSHNGFHGYEHFLTNRLTFADCGINESRAEIVNTIGQAGDVFLFDANGMHRGVRSPGALRDAMFLEYTADKNPEHVWGTDLPAGPRAGFRSVPALSAFLEAEPLWQRNAGKPPRKRPTWAESLENPALWV